jgi:hypothetical protein
MNTSATQSPDSLGSPSGSTDFGPTAKIKRTVEVRKDELISALISLTIGGRVDPKWWTEYDAERLESVARCIRYHLSNVQDEGSAPSTKLPKSH